MPDSRMTDPRVAHFDALFRADPDPWHYRSSPYERAKYAATLAATAASHFQSVVEVGCANGELGALLAPRAERYLGLDCSAPAITLARARLAGFRHSRVRQCQVPRGWPRRPADLILLSEVAYYLTPDELQHLCARIHTTLMPGGEVVIVCYTGQTQTPLSGAQAAQIVQSGLLTLGGYRCRAHQRAPGYCLTAIIRDHA